MIDEIKIMQLADGSLDPKEREEVLNAIKVDPKLQKVLKDYQFTRDILSLYAKEVKSKPLPESLLRKIEQFNSKKKIKEKTSFFSDFLKNFSPEINPVLAAKDKKKAGTFTPPTKDLLSDIIETINSRYGVNLTEDDKVNINTIRQKIFVDEVLKKYMSVNSEPNKKDFFKKKFDYVILSLSKDSLNFYKKLNENLKLKNLIFEEIYKNYRENQK